MFNANDLLSISTAISLRIELTEKELKKRKKRVEIEFKNHFMNKIEIEGLTMKLNSLIELQKKVSDEFVKQYDKEKGNE